MDQFWPKLAKKIDSINAFTVDCVWLSTTPNSSYRTNPQWDKAKADTKEPPAENPDLSRILSLKP